LSINTDLGWQELLEIIEAAQKYVELDLSQYEMSGTVFNPDSGISAGKDKIISIILPDKATGIAAGSSEATSAFHGFANLRSFSGANLASIGAYAFCKCAKLNPDTLPSGITSIGNYAFDGCSKLALTELPGGLTKINSYSFRNCTSLALTTLPPGVTEIATYAFSGCKNLALTRLPPDVKNIQTNVFNNCSSLTEMTIYDKVTNIGTNAFSGCGSLTLFICLAEAPPTLGTGVFNKSHSELVIKVPAASLNAYKAAKNWSDYTDRIIKIN